MEVPGIGSNEVPQDDPLSGIGSAAGPPERVRLTKQAATLHSVQAPELPFDRRDEPAEALRGQIRGEGLELLAGSSSGWERMAHDEPW